MVKLDSNAAWKEASATVAANREVLFALGGVFFLLPGLMIAVIAGEPEVVPGMNPQEMQAAMGVFYAENWWLMLIGAVLQVVGLLAILTLMRDRSRPTVAEAITAGLGGTLTYFAATVLYLGAVVIAGGVLTGLAAAASPVFAVVVVLLVLIAVIWLSFRLILLAPIIAVEGQRNPIAALSRSWRLTEGNFWRIFGFLFLLAILFFVVLGIIMLVVGMILALATSGETQRIIAAVFSSALTAVAVVYFAGVVAAIHRQLSGPGAADLTATFE